MKFLPIKEFEKRQKSINPNQNLSLMNSMMTKVGVYVDASRFISLVENLNQLEIPNSQIFDDKLNRN